jgi:hypothetical protein
VTRPALLALLLLAAPAADPPAVQTFRTSLVTGDTDRSWTVAWSRDGNLHLVYDLLQNGKKTASITSTATAFEQWYDSAYYGRADLPDGVKPGAYQLDTGGGVLNVTVTAAPNRKVLATPVPAGNSSAAVRSAFAAGNRVVTLAPGEHVWDSAAVALPENAVLRGYGATVRRSASGGEYNARALVPTGANVSVYGVTFVYDVPGQVFHCAPGQPQPGLVVADCVFKRCNLGWGPTDVLIRDTRFDSAGCIIAPPGLYYRCTWTGPPTQHAFHYWGGGDYSGKHLALIDNIFDGCDRGPVFNAAAGPVNDNLFVGTSLRNINATPDGNESFACEGAGSFDHNLFLHTRAHNCDGPVFQPSGNGDTKSRDGLVRDLTIDGGFGIVFWGAVSGWTVQDFEIRRGGIYCGAGPVGGTVPAGNAFTDGTVTGFCPTRGNQTFQNLSPVALGRTAACVDDSGGKNTLARIRVLATAPGCRDVAGFKPADR